MEVIKEVVTETAERVRMDVRCNRCGGSCVRRGHADAPGEPSQGHEYGLIEAEVHGGYFSDPLLDMTSYRFSLCEACLAWLFDQCALPPVVECQGSGEVTAWEVGYRAKYEARVATRNATDRAALVGALPSTIPAG